MSLTRTDSSGSSDAVRDLFTTSRYVTDLTPCSFTPFLRGLDVVMVMFYDPSSPVCCLTKKHVEVAAETTVRENHAYAAVNCKKDPLLCDQEGVFSHPYFKLYSRGFPVGTLKSYSTLTANDMRKFVEKSPVLMNSQA